MFQYLIGKGTEKALLLQVLRSGTSIGANIEEAMGASSSRDFVNKLSISYKEARETRYWLRLLKDTQLLEPTQATSLLADCNELIRIIGSIQKTMKTKKNALKTPLNLHQSQLKSPHNSVIRNS
jgi:four helix bundle protein